jgi:EmrB/QacA subfamily drug resistance transporter
MMPTYRSSPSTRAADPRAILAVLALACLSFALLQAMISPALGALATALHVSPADAAWALTAFLLSASVATPIVGRLGDIYGKRRMLIAVLVVLAAGTLVSALASTLGVLVAGRVAQGVGAGIFPLAFAIVRDELPRERVAGSIGLISAILGLGAGIGVVLAGVIIDLLSIHWLFWIPLAGILCVLAGALAFVPESPVRDRASINWTGAALMSAGLATVLLAVSRTGVWGWGDARTLTMLASGLVLIGAWVASETRSASPLVDMRMMRLRGVWPVNLLGALLGFALFSALILLPELAQSPTAGFGDSVTVSGLLLVPLAFVMLLVGPMAGRLEARVGPRLPALSGGIATLAGFAVILAFHDSRPPLLLASALLGLGIGLAFAAMANLIVQAVPLHQTGVATGMNTVARTIGGAFGAQITATLVAASPGTIDGYDHAFQAIVAALALAVVAGLAIAGPRPEPRFSVS